MWARVVELMLGVWLLASPFIFGYGAEQTALWARALGFGTLVIVLSCLSYWEPTRQARIVTLAAGTLLAGIAYFSAVEPYSAALQNEFVVGVLLLMFAIVPNDASEPPRGWREYVQE